LVSRYLVIALAFIAGAMRISQGGWVEAAGLFGLGAGLAMLKLAAWRPALKPAAYVFLAITFLCIVIVLIRRFY
jgi:hypothetical protein